MENKKQKAVLLESLGLNPNLNLQAIINEISVTNLNAQKMDIKINEIIHNQRMIEQKIDLILNLLYSKQEEEQ